MVSSNDRGKMCNHEIADVQDIKFLQISKIL